MLQLLPRQLPPLAAMLADLAEPTVDQLAAALEVNPRTVRRWLTSGDAPRLASLALFSLTRWGRSLADSQAHNDAVLHAQLARARADEIARLERRIAHLLAISDFACANDPLGASGFAGSGSRARAPQPLRVCALTGDDPSRGALHTTAR